MKKIIFSKDQVCPLDIDMLFSESKRIVDLVLPNSNLLYLEDLIHRIKPDKISKCYEANLKQKDFGLMLRHDVDHSIDLAYLMSIVEDMHKIKSTYFFLHPDNIKVKNYMGYFDDNFKLILNDKFKKITRKMQSNGHEIGLHYDLITLSLNTGINTGKLLENILTTLRKEGIIISGCVAHGNKLAQKYKYNNYLVFKECKNERRKNLFFQNLKLHHNDHKKLVENLNINKLSLNEFGLDYEANFIKREYTITDSGGGIKLEEKNKKDQTRLLKKGFSLAEYEFFFNKFGFYNMKKGDLSLLIHPDWWCPLKRISNVSYNKNFSWRHF